jgi:lipopolysaccharide transport system permease protein
LITKIYFPRSLLPAAAVVAGLADFIVASLLFAGMVMYYRVPATPHLLLAPVIVSGVVLLGIGLGLIFSAVNVKYRDVRHALPFLIQVWMFASPVIYPAAIVPERWRWMLAFNPMTGFIETFRAAVFAHKPINWGILLVSATITLVVLLAGSFFFRRLEKSFADVI